MRTIDEDFFDDVLTIGEPPGELVQVGPPLVPTERFRAADLDDHPGGHQGFDGRPIPPVDRSVEALHQFPDRII